MSSTTNSKPSTSCKRTISSGEGTRSRRFQSTGCTRGKEENENVGVDVDGVVDVDDVVVIFFTHSSAVQRVMRRVENSNAVKKVEILKK